MKPLRLLSLLLVGTVLFSLPVELQANPISKIRNKIHRLFGRGHDRYDDRYYRDDRYHRDDRYYDDDAYYAEPAPRYRQARSLEGDVQLALARRGFYRGPIDGIIGSQTRAAIRDYQIEHGLPVTGTIDRHLVRSLRL